MITDFVAVPLMPRRDADASVRVACSSLINLRPGGSGVFGGQLGAVGAPEVYAGTSGCMPLCRMVRNGRPALMSARGRDIVFSDIKVAALAPSVFAGVLPASALCAAPRSDSEALVMTSEGPVKVCAEGGSVAVSALESEFPAVSLLAEDVAGAVTADVQSRKLSRVYSGAEALDERDADTLASDMLAAYRRICVKAAAAGRMVQPVLARYRLVNKDGKVLFVSAPVLLAHSGGVQCASGVGVTSADRQTLGGYTLSASVWTPAVFFHEATGARAAEVAACEVYMSPMFHPFVPGARAAYNTGRGSDASQPFVTVSLPGNEASLSNGTPGATRRVLAAALARLDGLESRVAVINNPFGASARKVTFDVTPSDEPEAEAAALRAAMGRPAPRYTHRQTLLSLPHGFTAACTAADASSRAWGDISVRRFAGYSAANFAAAVSPSAWQAVSTVIFSDGSSVVRHESHATGAPLSLSPVLTYPASDAVTIMVDVSVGNSVLHGVYTLEPEESGRSAVFVAEKVGRLSLGSAGAVAPTVRAPSDRYAGTVIIADDRNPLAPVLLADTGECAVKTLVARRSSDQSWEFGRSRFVAAGGGGIFSIGVGAGLKNLSVRRLSELPVSGGGAICSGESAELYVLAGADTLDGPSLYSLDGKGSMTQLSEGRAYSSVAYDAARRELMACRLDGSADVFCLERGYGRYRRRSVGVTAVTEVCGTAYGTGGAGIVQLGTVGTASEIDAEAEFYVRHEGNELFVPKLLELGIEASEVDISVTVEGIGTCASGSWPLAVFTVRGACRSAIATALRGRPVRAVRIHLRGDVSPDFVFDSLKIRSTLWK